MALSFPVQSDARAVHHRPFFQKCRTRVCVVVALQRRFRRSTSVASGDLAWSANINRELQWRGRANAMAPMRSKKLVRRSGLAQEHDVAIAVSA
jgi:hypothetical protein